MKVRCFISINLPGNIKNEIVKVQNLLPEFTGKKTETENLHLTLKFLGHIEEEKLEELKKRLRKIRSEKFQIVANKIGFFNPRIVWFHLANCEALQKEIDDALDGLFEKEKRFMSHLTIARVKGIKDKKRFLDGLSKIKIKNIWFDVDNFCLMKSQLRRNGPLYSVIEEFPLL